MEYCPYCQRWVEPKKDYNDLIAGGVIFGAAGALVGGAHHLLKGSRCPICNNIIQGRGAATVPPQALSQPPHQQYPPPPLPYQMANAQRSYPPAPQPLTPGTSHNCPRCGQPLVWTPQLQRWYCYYCKT